MTTYPAWTPASRPGIIPLHPLGFGTILGRSFAALRHNPRVLLGFALGVQTVSYLLLIVGTGAVAWATFSRLDTVRPGSDEYEAILAGSIAVTAITAGVLALAAGALGVIVQGVVVSEVAHAAVAEKLTLRRLWQRVRPVAWRLIGYTFLLILAVLLLFAVVGAALVALGFVVLPVAIGLGVLAVIVAIPLNLWISTKLMLVPSAIILEQATIVVAIRRSWQLTRGRFWPALGVLVIVSVIFSVMGQVVSYPFSILTSLVVPIIAPTGDTDSGAIAAFIVAALLAQIMTLAIQAVAVVVQSTTAALIYIDCRMRREGLDLALLAYVERRDAGDTLLRDPYLENIGREIAPRPPAWAPHPGPTYGTPAPGHGPPPALPHGGYPPPTYGTHAPGAPYGAPPPQFGAQPPYGAPPAPPAAPAASPSRDGAQLSGATPAAPPRPEAPIADPVAPPAPNQWTAPGADNGDTDSPWA